MVTATTMLGKRETFLTGNGQSQGKVVMPKLPPSERDFLVFEAVAFGGTSTRQAAAEFGISQTRVMQIRREVADWIARSVPEDANLTSIQRLRVAAHIAEGRVDYLYAQAMDAWRASQQPRTSICRGGLSGEVQTTRDSYGDPRYLMVAARIAERQLSLAGTANKVLAGAEDGSKFNVQSSKLEASDEPVAEREGEALVSGIRAEPLLVQDSRIQPEATGAIPPVGDCSTNEIELPVGEVPSCDTVGATEGSEGTCSEIEERRRAFLAALADDTAPVHPPFTDAGGMLLDATEPMFESGSVDTEMPREHVLELKMNGHEPGASVSAVDAARPMAVPLNRHQRRARQRELDRLRRRAK
jgi:hypothetical protein